MNTVSVVDSGLNILAMLFCAGIFGRMFTFQREGRRYRFWMSASATLVMICCGASVFYILGGKVRIEWHDWPLVTMLGIFAIGIFKCRGNLAGIFHYDNCDRKTERRRHG